MVAHGILGMVFKLLGFQPHCLLSTTLKSVLIKSSNVLKAMFFVSLVCQSFATKFLDQVSEIENINSLFF